MNGALKNETSKLMKLHKNQKSPTYVSRLTHVNCPCLQITFVAHQHHRHFFRILNAFYLFTICSCKEFN